MDTDMTDAAYDIDIDVGAGIGPPQAAPQPATADPPTAVGPGHDVPAAYFEDLEPQKPWPESLNLQGVTDFDPNDPLYYSIEHCGAEPRVKQLRWVSDSSVNLEFYTAADAAAALAALTHPDVANPGSLAAQATRRAKPYSKKPDSQLVIRETNAGDQKPKGAATRSNYYKHNPDVAENRQRDPRRRPPPKDFLDYGDTDMASADRRRRSSGDESMNGASQADRRRNYRNARGARDSRGRGGRMGSDSDVGRLRNDVDSYRPGSEGPGESRFGRLRNRSASPASNDEGDGRFGFAEDTSNARRRYRSRSRSRSRNTRRRREPSGERWTHDRANHDRAPAATGRHWQRDTMSFDNSPMGNHRRSGAKDETSHLRHGGSLLARMTKDGKPVAPQKRSLADRITRDDGGDSDDNFGRLKGDDSVPFDSGFEDPKPARGLADRITRDDDINIRGRSQEGINIRGSASNGARGGFNIRGVASGA